MKIKFFIMAGALALLASVSAKAQTSWSQDDLFLSVRNDSTSNNSTIYLLDLGNPFNYSQSSDFSIAGLTTDLNAVVGTGWATNPNVVFSVWGGNFAGGSHAEQIYATNPTSTAWNSTHSEGTAGNDMSGVANYFNGQTPNDASGLNSQVLIEGNGDSLGNDLPITGNGQSMAFGAYSPDIEGPVTGSLNFDYQPSTASGVTAPATLEGSFALDAVNQSLDFTTAAVPEPSTIAGVILGGIALIAARRRRQS